MMSTGEHVTVYVIGENACIRCVRVRGQSIGRFFFSSISALFFALNWDEQAHGALTCAMVVLIKWGHAKLLPIPDDHHVR